MKAHATFYPQDATIWQTSSDVNGVIAQLDLPPGMEAKAEQIPGPWRIALVDAESGKTLGFVIVGEAQS